MGKRSKSIGCLAVLALMLVGLIGVRRVSAQYAETEGDQSPALIAGRDAIVTYGLTPEQVQELTKAAAAGAVGPLADKIVELSNVLGVTRGATLTLLHILDQQDVPLEQLPGKLAEVASHYQKFQVQLAALNPENPLARSLVDQARAEIRAATLSRPIFYLMKRGKRKSRQPNRLGNFAKGPRSLRTSS